VRQAHHGHAHIAFKGAAIANACHTLRRAMASKRKGKSGGVRVILHIVGQEHMARLLAINGKSDLDSIPEKEIKRLFEEIPL
jgi:hypothetical protein